MKKLLSYVVLGLVGAFVLVGCKPKDTEPVAPATPPTNSAPATP